MWEKIRRNKTGKIQLAIIGYGYMGHVYHQAFRELKIEHQSEHYYKINLDDLLSGIDLVAVVDPVFKESDRAELEQEGVRGFENSQALFASQPDIGAAVIASPIPTHFDVARDCLERNISLLIEKPVCPTRNMIVQLDRLARSRGLVILPAHVERYNPVCIDAREYVDYKIMGTARNYTLRRCSVKPDRVRESLIVDKLIHDVDLAHALFGPFRVKGVEAQRKGDEIMQVQVATAHGHGLTGKILSSWLIEEKERSIQIEFERGRLYGDLLQKKMKVYRSQEFSKEITGYRNNQIKDQLLDFLAYLRYPTKPLVHIKDALWAAKIIDQVMEMAT